MISLYKALFENKKNIHENELFIMQSEQESGRNFDYGHTKSDSHEGKMAKDTLYTIIKNAEELDQFLVNEDDLPEWCHYHLAVVEDRLKSVNEYLQSQRKR